MSKYIDVEALGIGIAREEIFAKVRASRSRQMSKEHIEHEAAKERLRIWLSGCVIDGAKMDKEETNELD